MRKCNVELVNMEFFAHHGCFSEEQIIGGHFSVSFCAEVDCGKAAAEDSVEYALNYQDIYSLIKEEMYIPSKILENVAMRILERVKREYPRVLSATVSVSKLNPPVGGKVEASRVTMSY
jgi:dihydroneopterin aldolase